ncbi:MAG: hypothetical protein CM15mP58_00440 [Burkholderiaceae bacterium]|nr:MAG: hypothetical protein CM15mP58_00440 [Burkholderiaceae bacterium]
MMKNHLHFRGSYSISCLSNAGRNSFYGCSGGDNYSGQVIKARTIPPTKGIDRGKPKATIKIAVPLFQIQQMGLQQGYLY